MNASVAPALGDPAVDPNSRWSLASLRHEETPFAIDVVATNEGIDALAPEWLTLERLSGAASVFQSHAQIRIWARHFLGESGARQRLHVVMVRSAGRPALLLPLAISGRGPLRIARLAGDPVGQYADILVDPALATRAAFDAALASVRADAIVLRRVRSDSHLLRLGADRLRRATTEDAAPFADLTPYASYDEFLRTLSKNMRKGLRNRRHHLEKAGEISFELLAGGPEARKAIEDAIGLKRRWLVQRGAVSVAFLDPHTRECLLDLAEHATGAVVMRLAVGGEPAAIRFGFEHQGAYFAYLSAYDQNFAHLAPGKMLMDMYVSRFKERGLERIDMLPPRDRHKTDWCRFETTVADYTLPLSRAGRAYVGFYQERLRPALRSTWHRLPDGIRSMGAALFVDI
jgi:CelD/BcsL family acetyltransferase involved in cellulose biosynthesis